MRAEVTLREAEERDLSAVLGMIAQPDYNRSAMDEAKARQVLARLSAYPYYKLLLAETDGEVVGTLCLIVLDNLGHDGAPIALLENVIVAAGRQGGGIGKAMVRAAGEMARAAGAYKLILATGLKRKPAHAFYESLGFTRYGYSYGLPLTEDEA